MKHIIILLALLPALAFGQNVRWDLPILTTQAQGGNLLPVYAVPGALVSFYNEPAGTLATTYNSATSVSACPTSAQVVLNGSATCVNSADPFGNMGGWFQPGQYMATIIAQGNSYNYLFTVATASAIAPGTSCGGALSGILPNCTIAGIGSAGSIPMSDGAGHLEPSGLTGNGSGSLELAALTAGGMVKATSPLGTLAIATSGTDYAPGTNPSGGQHNYAPLNDPSFTGGITSTSDSSVWPYLGIDTTTTASAGIRGGLMLGPNLGTGGSIGWNSGIAESDGNYGGTSFINSGSASLNSMFIGIRNLSTNPTGICVNGLGQVSMGTGSVAQVSCPISGSSTLSVNGNVAANSFNGVALTGTGGGTSFLSNAGTYIPITAAGVPVDVTGSRTFGPGNIYQNTNAYTLQASGFGVAVTGTATNNIACLIGPTSPPTMIVFSETNGATTIGGAAGFICPRIPATWFYEVNKTNDLSATPSSWIESPTI